ncbi:hypothetical protein CAP47_01285 [Psychroflexus sp. S27]|nr:hypothetical protein CAP47_01285 [Psychroflexus sp. S27]
MNLNAGREMHPLTLSALETFIGQNPTSASLAKPLQLWWESLHSNGLVNFVFSYPSMNGHAMLRSIPDFLTWVAITVIKVGTVWAHSQLVVELVPV